jgi:hypothetical protein
MPAWYTKKLNYFKKISETPESEGERSESESEQSKIET